MQCLHRSTGIAVFKIVELVICPSEYVADRFQPIVRAFWSVFFPVPERANRFSAKHRKRHVAEVKIASPLRGLVKCCLESLLEHDLIVGRRFLETGEVFCAEPAPCIRLYLIDATTPVRRGPALFGGRISGHEL